MRKRLLLLLTIAFIICVSLATVEPSQTLSVVAKYITPGDSLVDTLTSPGMRVLLLTLGLAGLIIEITTIGFGAPGVVGILALGLYFGGSIIGGQASGLVLVLFFLGIGLLIVEALLPGFGIAGISGLLAIIASVVLAAGDTRLGLQTVAVALLLSTILLVISFRYMARRKLFDRVSLHGRSTAAEGYLAGPKDVSLIGMRGVAITMLRPSGIAEVAGKRFAVVTEGGFVPPGTTITIIGVEGSRIVVAAMDSERE